MTRKHFAMIAAILWNRSGCDYSTIDFDNGYNTAVENITNDLADYFEAVNENFNRAMFIAASKRN